jgi:hypothetical protein
MAEETGKTDNGAIWFGIILLTVVFLLFVAVDYFSLWLDKTNCIAMNGSYSITNDGMYQTSTCQVSTGTMIISQSCEQNGVPINCSELKR